ncbi:hypothetical protein H6P81_010999 [Aristolochia fimbriata]|uniref:Remorin C-terminal domain-containing protein n=1 Tax=Aristolochia fimbriata TaxID=158543 RepID=A0AAV7ER14_ARIFI|nr:hypothetical protein H6P81_010999 [Aristolochia fimbriata]
MGGLRPPVGSIKGSKSLSAKGGSESLSPCAIAVNAKNPRMRGFSGIPDQKASRSGFRARDDSPDSVIFPQGSTFSLFSSASGSGGRCSFGSDVHDHESLVSDLSKHLAGRDLHDSCGPDLDPRRVSTHSNSNPIKNQEEGQEEDEEDTDSAKNTFSEALKECRNRRQRAESLPPKKHERRRTASVDLNGRAVDATISSPRFTVMKKTSGNSRKTGTFPSPGTPNYRGNGALQKGWSSERVALPANYSRRYANFAPLSFNNGKTLPSKWEDAEKWIFSPATVDGSNRSSMAAPSQRRPKSKSGPLGPPGYAYYAAASPLMMPVFDSGRVGNFMGNSPFSAGVLSMDSMAGRIRGGTRGEGGSHGGLAEPSIARSASVHGWSDLSTPASLPSSQDEKFDATRDAGTMISPAVSRRDMATQMSPEGSRHSSPKERPLDSPSPSLALPIAELQNHNALKLEVRDVQVDDCVTMTRWSKKHGSRKIDKSLSNIGEWRRKVAEARCSAWDVSETAKSISKFKREDAKITAWENLQKAKAEAEIRKLEVKLEKIRTSSMDKIMNKLRSAQRKAQEMRNSASASQAAQALSQHCAISM